MRECSGQRYFHNGTMHDCREFPLTGITGDVSVYEVIRVIRGVPLFLEDHLERLFRTVALQQKDIPYSQEEIMQALEEVIACDALSSGNIKILIAYGPEERAPSHLYVYQVEHDYPTAEQVSRGVSCILYHGERPQPQAKIVHHGLRLSIYRRLIATGHYEALLVNREERVTEGSRSNVFFVRGGTVITAPGPLVLAGISRQHVIRLCREMRLPLEMRALPVAELPQVEGAFLTGTSIHVLPVRSVEGWRYDTRHPLVLSVREAFVEMVEEYISARSGKE